MKSIIRIFVLLLFLIPFSLQAAKADQAGGNVLAGTRWRLVEFQSMDDAQGTRRPVDSSQYTMELKEDGMVSMQLDCNRATGTWSAEPVSDGSSGIFTFGPLAATMAACPQSAMDEFVASMAGYVRSYLVRDGRLYLSLMADGGIFVWEPVSTKAETETAENKLDETRTWKVTGVSHFLNLRAKPSASAQVIGKFAPGTLVDGFGCQTRGTATWCDVQQVGGGVRGFVRADYLQPASPSAAAVNDSADCAGQGKFDARGTLPCAQYSGQPLRQCQFGVARSGDGNATVVVTKPDGSTRAIFFRLGRAMSADTSQAEGYPPFTATREKDLHLVRIGEERYEIPHAVLTGD